MRTTLFSLSSSTLLLLLLAISRARVERQWPYNLPPEMKYYPEDEPLVRRNEEIQRRFSSEKPIAIRKMSDDEGEMFFYNYWGFDEPSIQPRSKDSPAIYPNSSLILPPSRPIFSSQQESYLNRLFSYHNNLQKRDFKCPGDTISCTSINRPNSCCRTGLTCNIIQDTGLGDVGCCGDFSCTGQVSACPDKYTACPAIQGGGCCVPGYKCEGVGCVLISTTTVIVAPSSTSTSSSSTSSPPPPPPPPTTTSTSSSLSPTSLGPISCSPGFRSCPPNEGGGCCATDRKCGAGVCPASSTAPPSSGSIELPVRPTSSPSAAPSPTPQPSEEYTPIPCPTNFYACSAFYPGGGSCCRINRDCGVTSCPPRVTQSYIVSNGVSILVAPTGAATASQGNCGAGWYSCGGNVGGGCCPGGFSCGTASCSADSPGQTGSVAKLSDASMGKGGTRLGWILIAVVIGLVGL